MSANNPGIARATDDTFCVEPADRAPSSAADVVTCTCDGSELLNEYVNGGASPSTRYAVLDVEIFSRRASGTRYVLVPDPLGSVNHLLNPSRTKVATYTFSPYGEILARRMFRYHVRIFDHFDREPVSVAVLADPNHSWRPNSFAYSRWGSAMRLEYPVVKLTDWTDRVDELASGANPFGIVVAAHLASLATQGRPEIRMRERLTLYRAVRRMGVSQDTASALWTFMDWVLDLPEELDDTFTEAVRHDEESSTMRYISRLEERAEERGVRQGKSLGIEEGKSLGILIGKAAGMRESLLFLLEGKFGALPGDVRQRVEAIDSTDRLAELTGRVLDVTSLEEMGI